MRRHVAIVCVLAISSAIAARAECKLSLAEESSVHSLMKSYRDGWFKPDAEAAVMNLLTHDATILPHHGVKPRTGHAEIRAFWFPPNLAGFQLLKLEFTIQKVEGCREIAHGWGTHTIEWKMKDDSKISFNAGTIMLIAKKIQGRWKIHRLMWDDPPNQTR